MAKGIAKADCLDVKPVTPKKIDSAISSPIPASANLIAIGKLSVTKHSKNDREGKSWLARKHFLYPLNAI